MDWKFSIFISKYLRLAVDLPNTRGQTQFYIFISIKIVDWQCLRTVGYDWLSVGNVWGLLCTISCQLATFEDCRVPCLISFLLSGCHTSTPYVYGVSAFIAKGTLHRDVKQTDTFCSATAWERSLWSMWWPQSSIGVALLHPIGTIDLKTGGSYIEVPVFYSSVPVLLEHGADVGMKTMATACSWTFVPNWALNVAHVCNTSTRKSPVLMQAFYIKCGQHDFAVKL